MGVGDRSLVGDSGDLVSDSRGRDSSKSVSVCDGLDNRSRGNLTSQDLSNGVGLWLSLSLSLAHVVITMSTGNWLIGRIYTRGRLGNIHVRGIDTSGIGDRDMGTIGQVGQRISFSFSFPLSIGVSEGSTETVGVGGVGNIVVEWSDSSVVSTCTVGEVGERVSLGLSLGTDNSHQACNDKGSHAACSGLMSTTVPMYSALI